MGEGSGAFASCRFTVCADGQVKRHLGEEGPVLREERPRLGRHPLRIRARAGRCVLCLMCLAASLRLVRLRTRLRPTSTTGSRGCRRGMPPCATSWTPCWRSCRLRGTFLFSRRALFAKCRCRRTCVSNC